MCVCVSLTPSFPVSPVSLSEIKAENTFKKKYIAPSHLLVKQILQVTGTWIILHLTQSNILATQCNVYNR